MPHLHRDLHRIFALSRDHYQSLSLAHQRHYGLAIAGGAAVDYSKAGDIDLFVLDVEHQQDAAMRLLTALNPNWDAPPATIGYDADRMLVGTAMFGASPSIQVITTTHCTPEELIESFDLSIHMQAVTPEGRIITCPKTTGLTQPIRVTRWDTPQQTLARLHRLASRYGVRPHAQDLMKLEEMAQAVAQ